MIRREDLLEAIAECEGVRHPTSSTCLKLASYYTILRQMDGEWQHASHPQQQYSFEADRGQQPVSNTDFAVMVAEKGYEKCMPVIDEAIQALLVVNPKMHDAIMRQLRSL